MELFHAAQYPEDSKYGDFVTAILSYYCQPHRCYHHVGHIMEGIERAFSFADRGKQEFNLSISQQLAWLCHDIVYVPDAPARQNEVLSCFMLKNLLKREDLFGDVVLELSEHENEACAIIMDTTHSSEPKLVSLPVLDLDLSGFAFENKFIENNEQLAVEFGLSEKEFEKGQVKFLSNLIESRITLYHTDFAIKTLERDAQSNLSKHINRIKAEQNM